MYIIWHDNDYDFAIWVYESTELKKKSNVILKQIPKTNEAELITSSFSSDTDYHILPLIKFATPDILIQKVENGTSKFLVAAEFMTHTSQHDHVYQRFERIYCISKERVPVAFVFPETKTKLEKGSRDSYKEVKYKASPLTVHAYLKTTRINQNPTLMFFWPQKDGYIKYDDKHQTAPKKEGQIINWINFVNECIKLEDYRKVLKTKTVKNQLSYLENKYPLKKNVKFFSVDFKKYLSKIKEYYSLERVKIYKTSEVIKKFKLNIKSLSKEFLNRSHTLVFSYTSRDFRTDPYCGFVCGFKNLFTLNNKGNKVLNFLHIPEGIKCKDTLKNGKKKTKSFYAKQEDLSVCPIHTNNNFSKCKMKEIKKHLKGGCIYTSSKQQRIFGTIPDAIIFKDYIYYNKNARD